MSEISPTHTYCGDCCFAEWGESGGRPSQAGCSLGRIDKFLSLGENVVVEARDDDAEFYVVNRVCNAKRKRGSAWAARHEGRWEERVREETRLRVGAVVYYEGDEAGLKERFAELSPGLAPREVVVVVNDRAQARSLHPAVLSWGAYPFDWKMTVPVSPLSVAQSINEGVGQLKKSSHCLSLLSNRPFTRDLARADAFLNERLDRFCVVCGDDGVHEVLSLVNFHKDPDVGGATAVRLGDGRDLADLREKALFLADRYGVPWLVRGWEEL